MPKKVIKIKKLNKLFWMRVALAVIAGTAATFIFEDIEGEERRWASIGFMIIVFIVTIIIAKGMKMQLPSSDRKKIVTQAIGSYVFLYLFTWIVSYTLVHSGSVSTGINISNLKKLGCIMWNFKTPGIPDELFERTEKVPITKEEVRTIQISKARLLPGQTVYDIGCGSGSIQLRLQYKLNFWKSNWN